ncbi:MAG: hypothetical protein AAGD92_04440 [Pseudomonadota bacterium]
MRTLTAIIIFLTGAVSVAYSYIGAYVELAQDMAGAETADEAAAPFFTLLDYILSGQAPPRFSTFLYIGALLIAISIVMLIVRRKEIK